MGLEQIPVAGQYGLFALSLSLNFFFIIQYLRGASVRRADYEDQVRISGSWQQAWEKSEDTKHDQAELLRQMVVTATTMERMLTAFPINNITPPSNGGSSA